MQSDPSNTVVEQGVPVDELDLKDQAKILPDYYFKFLAERAGNSAQAANMLTPENLRVIKQYARTVRALPQTVEEIKEELDYSALGIEPERIAEVNKTLHLHVDEWDKLERQIKELGPEIELFAESMQSRGEKLISSIEDSQAFQRIAAEKRAAGVVVYTSELTANERQQLSQVIEKRLGELIKEIEQTSRRIGDVDKRADWFHREIETGIKPRLTRLIKHIDSKLKGVDAIKLAKERDRLDQQIDELKAQYSAEVGYSFIGLLAGPIGLIITGGVFGKQAENTRFRKNELMEQRDALAHLLNAISPAMQSFERVDKIIRDLHFRTTDLNSATRRLADVWLYLNKFATASLEESRDLSSSADLESFVQNLSDVIRPWRSIGSICRSLSVLFEQLLEDSRNA